VFGTWLITPRLPQLYAKHPGLQLELLLPHRFPNLANREADLLITLDAPTNGRYVVSRLTELVYYLYGAPSYLDRHPPITTRAGLAGHDFIDYVQDQLMSNDLRYLDALTTAPMRRFSCTGMMAQYEAAVAGLGLAMLPPYATRGDGRLRQVLPGDIGESRTLWIAAPADLYRLTRVRVVWDFVRNMVEEMPQLFHLG
jgi:DNA-binding transcriptional LysR family regulator